MRRGQAILIFQNETAKATGFHADKTVGRHRNHRNFGGFLSRSELVPDPAAATTNKLKLLWLSCLNKDGLINISQGLHAYLKETGVPHVWHVDGNGHDATHWRNNLYLFAQKIFR